MTKQDFVNVFIRQRGYKKASLMVFVNFLISCCLYLGFSYVVMKNSGDFSYFLTGWFVAQIMVIGMHFAFSYRNEKSIFNDELVKDIIE